MGKPKNYNSRITELNINMFVHEEKNNNITLKEFCNRCGRSVKLGSGLFVNRIPDLNDIFTRQDNGYRFPKGDFICIGCDENKEKE